MSKKKSSILENILKFALGINILFALYRFTKNQQNYINILSQFIVSSFVILIIAIVIALIVKDVKKSKYLNSGIQVVDKMEGKEFEKFLSAHFETVVPHSRDFSHELGTTYVK